MEEDYVEEIDYEFDPEKMDIFDLPIFESPRGLITASERKLITGNDAKRRWDYFYRTKPENIREYFKELRDKLENKLIDAENVSDGNGLYIFGFIILLGLIPSIMYEIYWLIIAIIFISVISFISAKSKSSGNKALIESIEGEIASFEEKINNIISQIPKYMTDVEMHDFIISRTGKISGYAKDKLKIDNDDISLVVDLPPIIEWGYLQSEKKPGYKLLLKTNEEHFKLYRLTVLPESIYCVYFLQYMFPTKDFISTYSVFYDVIYDIVSGELSDEYYYKDVTSCRIENDEKDILISDKNKITQCTTFKLTVSSGDSIEVCMVDKNVKKTLNDYLKAHELIDSDIYTEVELQASKKISSEVINAKNTLDELDSAISAKVINDIRHQLRIRKIEQ